MRNRSSSTAKDKIRGHCIQEGTDLVQSEYFSGSFDFLASLT